MKNSDLLDSKILDTDAEEVLERLEYVTPWGTKAENTIAKTRKVPVCNCSGAQKAFGPKKDKYFRFGLRRGVPTTSGDGETCTHCGYYFYVCHV